MSKRNTKANRCLSSPRSRMRKIKSLSCCLTAQESLLLSLNHLSKDKEVCKPRFYFGPDQWLGRLTSHKPLNSSVTLCEMRMEELWSPACPRGWLHKERWVELLRQWAAEGTFLSHYPANQLHKQGWNWMGTKDFSVSRGTGKAVWLSALSPYVNEGVTVWRYDFFFFFNLDSLSKLEQTNLGEFNKIEQQIELVEFRRGAS